MVALAVSCVSSLSCCLCMERQPHFWPEGVQQPVDRYIAKLTELDQS